MISKHLLGYHDNKLSKRLVLKQCRECLDGAEVSDTTAGKTTFWMLSV